MIDRIRGLYFASHHFTRDLIGTIAPFTVFAAFVIVTYPRAQEFAERIFREYLVDISPWTFILLIATYLIGGYFIGALVHISSNLVHRVIQSIPRFGRKYSYTYWYNQIAKDIDAMYNRYFSYHQYLSSGAAVTPTDKINTLKHYFRRYNPDGFAEAYREFMKVDIVRAALVYSLLLLSHEIYVSVPGHGMAFGSVNTHVVATSLLVVIVAVSALPRQIRKVVRTEYFSIIATAKIKEDLDREREAELVRTLEPRHPQSTTAGLSLQPPSRA